MVSFGRPLVFQSVDRHQALTYSRPLAGIFRSARPAAQKVDIAARVPIRPQLSKACTYLVVVRARAPKLPRERIDGVTSVMGTL